MFSGGRIELWLQIDSVLLQYYITDSWFLVDIESWKTVGKVMFSVHDLTS